MCRALLAAVCVATLATPGALAQAATGGEAAISIIADFEDRSVAAALADPRSVLMSDCAARLVQVPARGKGSLSIEVGATQKGATIGCDLVFREATRFGQVDMISAFCWINEGRLAVGFRLQDARGRMFETNPIDIDATRRWVRIASDLRTPPKPRQGEDPPVYPVEVVGFVVRTTQVGRQVVFVDDLQVEHKVQPRELVAGTIRLGQSGNANEATRLYSPGATVEASVVMENRSRSRALDVTVDLAWFRPDGGVLQRQTKRINLPPSGVDFRSYQKLDFTQTLRDPGLFRLVAQMRAPGWPTANSFETSVAVIPGERRTRGRSTFFGVRSNLFREPEIDQALEIGVARDSGVNLLMLDVPWRLVEPRSGAFELGSLESAFQVIAAGDMAAMLAINEPPEHAATDAKRVEALARLIKKLQSVLGARVGGYLIEADALGAADLSGQLAAIAAVRKTLGADAEKLTLIPPSIAVSALDSAAAAGELIRAQGDAPLAFRVSGDTSAALDALDAFRQRAGITWRGSHIWLHDSAPLVDAGSARDRLDVTRFYLRAAAAGVGTLVRFDLRDDDNDPSDPAALCGLLRRDFSPKASLLGYALTARALTGCQYAGPVQGAPDALDSALFIAGTQQISVWMPRPNRILPAVLPVRFAAPADINVEDLERRPQPAINTPFGPLVPVATHPLLVAGLFKAAQPAASLSVAAPWFRVPAIAFLGTELAIEVDPPTDLYRSFVQLTLPKDAPYQASSGGLSLKGEKGTPIRHAVKIEPAANGADFERAPLTLHVSLEGESFELPIEVRPLATVKPLAASAKLGAAQRVGTLAAAAGVKATASGFVAAGFDPTALRLLIHIEDDRVVPLKLDAAGAASGDQLLVGVALEGASEHAEARLVALEAGTKVDPIYGTPAERVADWRLSVSGAKATARDFELLAPIKALGAESLKPGTRLLVAVKYIDDDADGFAPAAVVWGGGLDGSYSTNDFRWARLGE